MLNYRIAEARTRRGLSQSELAKLVGTTQQQIARYESGENDVKSSVMLRLSEVLEVPLDMLMGVKTTREGLTEEENELLGNYLSLSQAGRRALIEISAALNENNL